MQLRNSEDGKCQRTRLFNNGFLTTVDRLLLRPLILLHACTHVYSKMHRLLFKYLPLNVGHAIDEVASFSFKGRGNPATETGAIWVTTFLAAKNHNGRLCQSRPISYWLQNINFYVLLHTLVSQLGNLSIQVEVTKFWKFQHQYKHVYRNC